MKRVVVGGQARKAGKTSVMATLIRESNALAWTAVKISHHEDDAGTQDPASADGLPAHLDFLLSEETDPQGHGDTCRYLAAGARRALWLRARGGKLERALPCLLEALGGDEHVIIESNSLMGSLKPDLFLMVIDDSGREMKASARQFLASADAFVAVRHEGEPGAQAGTPLPLPEDKPVFPVAAGEWVSPALCRFVRERIATAKG